MDFANLPDGITLAYNDWPAKGPQKGVIVLIHGFPQTSYQFRKVVGPLSEAGLRVLTPDYRGAGRSSKDATDFTKTAMAADIVHLLDHLSITEPVHIVGHDIGGMVAFAFATRFPDRTATVNWGECPLPGTQVYVEDWSIAQFHFYFHSVPDLPEALVTGREKLYLDHFFSKLSHNRAAITEDDLEHYASMYSQPGALRCGFGVYRAFGRDDEENRRWFSENGKCRVRALGLGGAESRHAGVAERMMGEAHEASTFSVANVANSGHWIAEESPEGFVEATLRFIQG